MGPKSPEPPKTPEPTPAPSSHEPASLTTPPFGNPTFGESIVPNTSIPNPSFNQNFPKTEPTTSETPTTSFGDPAVSHADEHPLDIGQPHPTSEPKVSTMEPAYPNVTEITEPVAPIDPSAPLSPMPSHFQRVRGDDLGIFAPNPYAQQVGSEPAPTAAPAQPAAEQPTSLTDVNPNWTAPVPAEVKQEVQQGMAQGWKPGPDDTQPIDMESIKRAMERQGIQQTQQPAAEQPTPEPASAAPAQTAVEQPELTKQTFFDENQRIMQEAQAQGRGLTDYEADAIHHNEIAARDFPPAKQSNQAQPVAEQPQAAKVDMDVEGIRNMIADAANRNANVPQGMSGALDRGLYAPPGPMEPTNLFNKQAQPQTTTGEQTATTQQQAEAPVTKSPFWKRLIGKK